MKTIFLIRHAKSSWKESGKRDFDRPLNSRGISDAPEMGKRMLERNQIPDLVLSSEANRALSTAEAITKALGLKDEQLQTHRDLYLSSPDTILRIIRDLPEQYDSVAIVCHNPGISQANYMLSGHALEMVTCAISEIEFGVDIWQAVAPEMGIMKHYDYPKNDPSEE